MKLRAKTPERSSGVVKQNDYDKYRNQLATDFNHRCGYCDDKDSPRMASFEIDHFVPQKVDQNRVLDYTNLVYACKSCNNAKSNKWPTGDKNISNDGCVGWIDPCDKDYDAQFGRDENGKIYPLTTKLGKWMYENLKLWKRQHEILWLLEKLDKNIKELVKFNHNGKLPEEYKDMLLQLSLQYIKSIEDFFIVC